MMRHKAQAGFTLVEAMVTIAILGILASVALPAFNDFIASRRVVGIAESLQSDLVYARSEAVQRNTTVSVYFGSSCYQVFAGTGTASSCSTAPTGTTQLKSVTLDTADGISTSSTVSQITFSPERGDVAALTADAQVTASKNTALAVAVKVGRSGRAKACKPTGSSIGGYSAC